MDKKYYGLNEIDRKIEKHLDFDHGTFIEAGANDGVDQSNTCYFERHRGWTGVLVEPIPKQFVLCRKNRPNAKVFWSALTPPNQINPFVELTYCNLMTVTNHPEVNIDRSIHIETGKVYLHPEDPVQQIFAPARTISSVLEEARVYEIDLFSLDIEGFEKSVLRGLDMTRFKVKHFCVETTDPAGVGEVLGPSYQIIDQLSHHDYLFKLTF